MTLSSRISAAKRSADPGSIAPGRNLTKTRSYRFAQPPLPVVMDPGLALRAPRDDTGGVRRQLAQPAAYCFASTACSTALQAAGICASVIGGFGFGGSGGGFGCSTASLNQ
ncbi:hypothetical protein ACVWXQ_005674 [Bradyrhizobium sp. S3.14.4]